MRFVSIGPTCQTADILKDHNLRTSAYPFDYIYSSLDMIKHCIDTDFTIFLDKKYYALDKYVSGTVHTYYCPFLKTEILKAHHIAYKRPLDYDPTKGVLCPHHNLLKNKIDYDAFVRRIDRFISLIRSDEKVILFYYNRFTPTITDIINFAEYFRNRKNIYILGVLANKDTEKILYESDNCKIYQNYNLALIFSEINNKHAT